MSRDERPYFDNEFGIPWDEAQFACWLAVEAHWHAELWDVDAQAEKFARGASTRLRNHPSHKARR
jgi:hypothetical protein